MAMVSAVCWLALAAIHLLPALAVVQPRLLTRLYGVDRSSPVFVLLRHRAVMFAAIVAVAGWAAVDPAPRPVASVVVGSSMVGFLLLYFIGEAPALLRSIAIVDAVGLPFLAVAAWMAWA